MLTKLKNFVKSNFQDIFIILVVTLVALIAFGIGRLTAPKTEPIQIKNLEKASVEELKLPTEEGSVEETKTDYQGEVIGSVKSETH